MHRNGSLVGPLLLTLIGTALLVWNFRPEFPFWDLVAKYWPVVLIVWGIAKLAGALTPAPPGAPPWRPSLTLGELFLALLIVLFGLSASHWIHFRNEIPWGSIEWPWSETYSFTQSVRQPMAPNSGLRIDNPAGDARVTGGDANEIAVTVNKHIRASSEEEARKLDPRMNVEITREGQDYVVRMPAYAQLRADLEIVVPRATPLDATLRHGGVQASDLQGPVHAEVERGDATFSNIAGDIHLVLRRGSLTARDVKGNIEVEGHGSDIQASDVTGQVAVHGEYSGAVELAGIAQGVRFNSSRTDLEVQKLPGRLDMTLGALSVTGPGGLVSVSTRNKDIRIEDFTEKVQIVDRGASVELRTARLPLHDIAVENHSGPIELTIPANSEFQIEATARRGEIDSEFASLGVERANDARSLKGQIGQPGATIKLDTSYGTISLRKLGPETQQPQPAPRKPAPRRLKPPVPVTASL